MRALLSAILAAVILSGCAILPGRDRPMTVRTHHAEEAARLISTYRAAKGLPTVRVDAALMRSAAEQGRAVARADALSHSAAGSFAGRMDALGVASRAAENLAGGQEDLAEALATWKASPGHDRNLLLPGATRIGLVEVEAPDTRFKRFWVLVIAD